MNKTHTYIYVHIHIHICMMYVYTLISNAMQFGISLEFIQFLQDVLCRMPGAMGQVRGSGANPLAVDMVSK